MSTEEVLEYPHYERRFAAQVGSLEPGQYGTFAGRLVRRLDQPQFDARVREYLDLGRQLTDRVLAGDTIDDALAVDLRAAEIDLVLAASLFLPPRLGGAS